MQGPGFVKDCSCFVFWRKYYYEQMFSRMVLMVVKRGRQAKVDTYGESMQTRNVYADDWKSRVNASNKFVIYSIVAKASAVKEALKASPAFASVV